MRTQLRRVWESRAPRERTIIAISMVVLGAALYGWLVYSGGRAHTQLQASVTSLRTQAARLDQQVAEVVRLRAAPAITASQADLRSQVQASADAAGLSLLKIDAPDTDRVVVAFGAVAFADWVSWVASLKFMQVRLDSCRIESLSTPGMVKVTATLARAAQQ